MTDLDHPPTIDINDDRSIAVRRKRRSSAGPRVNSRSIHGISTPPTTPKRSKKRVRFSDPGPPIKDDFASSGLTPFIRRTSLGSATTKRRHSAPFSSTTVSNRTHYDEPLSGTLQFAPLRQVLDGRVKRRLRRNRLSEEVNSIELDKRREAKNRKREVERLRRDLELKDAEMQSMRDEHEIASQLEIETGTCTSRSTDTRLNSRVEELEQQIATLKAELQQKEIDSSHWDPNWTMAARDPFHEDENDNEDDFMITTYDEDFSMNDDDEVVTTPTRLITFPSPPSTLPNTPCRIVSAGIQTSPDAENIALQNQLRDLEAEISKLNSSIAFKDDHHSRLEEKLSEFIPVNDSYDHSTLDAALDTVLTQLALTQSQAVEKSQAFEALNNEISHLGFPGGSDEIISSIAAQFRQARLDLEYLTPGEVVEGFENDKLLSMLVSRIRVLLAKTKEQDDTIDQYHDQEVLIRQQLNTRVDALQDCQNELHLATCVVSDLRTEIEEKDLSNSRLQDALRGYRDEVSGLERLIERLEQESAEKLNDEVLEHEVTRADNEGNEMLVAELSRRLQAALAKSEEMQVVCDAKDDVLNEASDRESRLRDEIESVNLALREAQESVDSLTQENRILQGEVEQERSRARVVIMGMREQLSKVLDMGLGYLSPGSEPAAASMPHPQIRGPANKMKMKPRRKYDSGLGFLDEADVEEEEEGIHA